MRRFAELMAVILAAAIALGTSHASAGSWKSKKGKSKGKYEEHYEAGDCAYKFKSNAKGHGRKIKSFTIGFANPGLPKKPSQARLTGNDVHMPALSHPYI